jgi:hypothetical protein
MSWILPVPLLLFAAAVALLPLAALVHRPTSAPRLVVEAFAVTLAIITAVWAAWLLLWLLESPASTVTQRTEALGLYERDAE